MQCMAILYILPRPVARGVQGTGAPLFLLYIYSRVRIDSLPKPAGYQTADQYSIHSVDKKKKNLNLLIVTQ